ncbi:MAG: Ppx/GppA phosphatase family protein [Verrucomicrobiia bacterium]|jgi:exopolyphosphatase/guanosine-5'-triphosphate,3'-diphosphate pyrophosphatase
MRRAVIDIGTNTVKLLVAEVRQGQVVPLVAKDCTTRLGEGLSEHKRLSPSAIARTVEAVKGFHAEAKAQGAEDVIALTTSASRDAANRDEFFEGVRRACGLEVQLISGDREAELIFRGVSSDPEWSGARILVVDVGGGSAEFIQGAGGKMEIFRSLPLGALRLTEKFGEGRFAELCQYLQGTLRGALADYKAGSCRMIATGGTMVTLARVECGAVDHATISRAKLQVLVRRLEAMPLAERKKVPGLPPERADIIVAGGAVLLTAMEVLKASELTVSVRNLRYGALVSD